MAALAILWTGIVWRGSAPMNADTSWLLTVGEDWLDGARLYVDVFETNPPASIAIYLPGIWLARSIGVTPEAATNCLVLVAALANLILAAAIMVRGGLVGRERVGGVLLVGLALLILTPGAAFAQREHVAAMFALPLVAALAARTNGVRPPVWMGVAAGLCGGLTLAIKPMFGLAFVGPALVLLARRGWAAAIEAHEGTTAGAVALCYAAAVYAFCPAYLASMVPWTVMAYLPARASLTDLLTSETSVVTMCLAAVPLYAVARGRADPLTTVLVLAALGFLGAFVLQGKLWPYHALPAILFAAAALAMVAEAAWRRGDRAPAVAGMAACAALACAGTLLFDIQFNVDAEAPGLRQALASIGPHPRLMSIDPEIAVGHPLVRDLRGQWVGRLPSTWISGGRAAILAADPNRPADRALDDLVDTEKAIVANDMATRHPDAIMVGTNMAVYAASTAALRAAFADYHRGGDYGPVRLWLKDGIVATTAQGAGAP